MSHYSKPMTEEDVKRKLNISDFRQLSKDKVVGFVSYLNKMDPEVAKKALEQVPEFAYTAREAINNTQKSIDRGMLSNDESVKEFYVIVGQNAEAIRNELNNDELSFDQRKEIIDSLIDITRIASDKDSENKKHIEKETYKAIAASLVAVLLVGVSIGISVKNK